MGIRSHERGCRLRLTIRALASHTATRLSSLSYSRPSPAQCRDSFRSSIPLRDLAAVLPDCCRPLPAFPNKMDTQPPLLDFQLLQPTHVHLLCTSTKQLCS